MGLLLKEGEQGRFYIGAGGHRPPKMLAKPPQNILVPTAKKQIKIVLYSGEINTRIS